MNEAKKAVLAYMHKSGRSEEKEISVPALDRYLVYIKREGTYVGGALLAVLQQMMDEGTLVRTSGSNVALTQKGRELPIGA